MLALYLLLLGILLKAGLNKVNYILRLKDPINMLTLGSDITLLCPLLPLCLSNMIWYGYFNFVV